MGTLNQVPGCSWKPLCSTLISKALKSTSRKTSSKKIRRVPGSLNFSLDLVFLYEKQGRQSAKIR